MLGLYFLIIRYYNPNNMIGKEEIKQIFTALDRQIQTQNVPPIGLVVCGGTALAALDLITRTTRDVDILASVSIIDGDIHLQEITAFPPWLQAAALRVGRDFNLPEDWLNLGPSAQMKSGLPDGFTQRLVKEEYGPFLTIFFLGRFDQIHFKLYAAIDGGPGERHVQDLLALKPQADEMDVAAKWVLSQDASPDFRLIVKDFLEKNGYESIIERI